MADTVVHIGENSPEQVAYKLMERIADVEERSIHSRYPGTKGWTAADRKWLLDTYAECLLAVRSPSDRG